MAILIGPSHIHEDHAPAESMAELRKHFIVDSHCGMCNFSRHCRSVLEKHLKNTKEPVIWIVIDWRVGNYDHAILARDGITDTPSQPNNISHTYITPEIDAFLIDYQKNMLHELVKTYPQIRLVFWCAYVRTCKGVSWPSNGQYPNLLSEFSNNIIDVRSYIPPEDLQKYIVDDGGHLNQEGHKRLLACLLNALV